MALTFQPCASGRHASLRQSHKGMQLSSTPLACRTLGRSPRMIAAAAQGTATIIDGKETAATIRKEIAAEVAELKGKTGKVGEGSTASMLPVCMPVCQKMPDLL